MSPSPESSSEFVAACVHQRFFPFFSLGQSSLLWFFLSVLLYFAIVKYHFRLRREKLALQYFTKLQSCPSNPAFECIINPKYKELFARKESAIPSFGIRMQSVLDNSNILNENIHETVIPEVPPWTLHQPRVNLDLSNLCKDTSSLVFIQKYNEIKDEHSYCTIYSVRHVLIDCIDLGLIRPRFYTVPDMKTLFDTISVDRILSFVKEVNLFNKI